MQDIKISIVQFDQAWENIPANLMHIESLLERLGDTDLILLPEMFHTGFSMKTSLAEDWNGNKALAQLLEWSNKYQAAIYTSLMVKENLQFLNRGVFVEPTNKTSIYDKRRSFGLGGEDTLFTAGTSETIVTYMGWKFNLQICYDLRFPELIRNRLDETGSAAYDILLYVANWPKKRVLHWSTLLQARAIENQCYSIGVNRVGTDGNQLEYSGNSVVFDGLGTKRIEMDDLEAVQTITLCMPELQALRKQLPFLKDKK
jgi:predicted amidohydrolase